MYIVLPLPSLMTKNNFWTSGLRLLTKAWQNLFSSLNESEADANDILLSREQAQIPVICVKERQRKRARREFVGDRINPPLPSILLANMQSLDNKIDDLHRILNYQRNIQNCNILCFTETWLNDDTINIQLAGYTLYRQDRTVASGKTRGGG
jgi:hypothetical protein